MILNRMLAACIAAGLALCAPIAASAQRISDLPAATTLGGTEWLRGIQGSNCLTHTTPCADVRISPAQLATYINASLDPQLAALAALTPSADQCSYWTSLTAASLYNCSSFMRTLGGSANAAAARTSLGTVIGTDVQAYSATLATIVGLSPSANDFLQYKSGAWANRTIAQVKADLGLPASADVQIFTVSGTWTKPAFGSFTRVIAFAGGGGGGNGVVVAASTAASGGGGGGAGMVRDYVVSTSSLGSTETVTVGAAGTAGVAGGNSSFGAWVTAYGGGAGSAGASGAASGGGGSGGFAGAGGNASGATGGAAGLIGGAAGGSGAAGSGSNLTTGAGGGSSATGSSFIGGSGGLTAASGGSGGGSGGGLTAANGTNNGAASGPHRLAPTGAAGGTAPGGAGANNGAAPAGLTDSGAGGGGGASATAANGGNGGAGQSPGGGGGGGGSTQTGFTAGTGGTGGAGKIIVITI